MTHEKVPATFLQISQALSTLGVEIGTEHDFDGVVKKAFRRLARLHHPDRFGSDTNSLLSKEHEEIFKKAKEAYELLSFENEQGRWPPVSPGLPSDFFFFNDIHTIKPFEAHYPESQERRPAKIMHHSQVWQLAREFVSSLILRAKDDLLSGKIKSQAFLIFKDIQVFSKTSPALGFLHHPDYAKSGILNALWSFPIPNLFETFSQVRMMLKDQGLNHWGDWIDFSCQRIRPPHSLHYECFELASLLVQVAPTNALLPEHYAYYDQIQQYSVLSDPSSLICYQDKKKPFMSKLLKERPFVAEFFASRCPINSMATTFWLSEAIQSSINPVSCYFWFNSMTLDTIMQATLEATKERRSLWIEALKPRMLLEGRPDLCSESTNHNANEELGRQALGLDTLERIETRCSVSQKDDQATLTYDPSFYYTKGVFFHALNGDFDFALSLAHRASELGYNPFTMMGTPLSVALAAKAWREPSLRQTLLTCLTQFAPKIPHWSMLATDTHGNNAASWLILCAKTDHSTIKSSQAFK